MLAQLGDLQQAGGDAGAFAELQNQLAALKSLSQNIASASGTALMQLRGEVAATVSASRAVAQQAQASVAASAAMAQASYAMATGELDHRAAVIRMADQRNNDLAHDAANRAGIDLTAYDRERAALEEERQRAIQQGDKLAERKADALITQNTSNTMAAGLDGITDPAERSRYLQTMAEQQQNAEEMRKAYEKQLELEGRKQARENGYSPEATEVYVKASVAGGMQDLDERSKHLAGGERDQAARATLRSEINKEAQEPTAVTPHPIVAAAPTATSEAAAQMAANDIAAAANHYTASISLDLSSGMSGIALSTAPDAHEVVEVPKTITTGKSNSHALG